MSVIKLTLTQVITEDGEQNRGWTRAGQMAIASTAMCDVIMRASFIV